MMQCAIGTVRSSAFTGRAFSCGTHQSAPYGEINRFCRGGARHKKQANVLFCEG